MINMISAAVCYIWNLLRLNPKTSHHKENFPLFNFIFIQDDEHPVQFSRSVMPDSLWSHGLQHARLPCPSPTPRAYSNSCPLSESVMPSNHLILCCHLLLPPSIIPSIRVFSNESVLHIRWPKDWSFSFSISPSKEYSGLISFTGFTGWIALLSKGLLRVFSNIAVQKHQFFGAQLSL